MDYYHIICQIIFLRNVEFQPRDNGKRATRWGRCKTPRMQIIPEGDTSISPIGRYIIRRKPYFTPRSGISCPQGGHFIGDAAFCSIPF